MLFVTRIAAILLGLAVLVLFTLPGLELIGIDETWWAEPQPAPETTKSLRPPPIDVVGVPAPDSTAREPASGAANRSATGEVPPQTEPTGTDQMEPHAVQPSAASSVGAQKQHRLAAEQAEAERLAALEAKPKAPPPSPSKTYYRVHVRDAGTLEAGDIVITLDGVEARDAAASCPEPGGGKWPCGAMAKLALTKLIRYRAVSCALPKDGEKPSFAARCSVAGVDLSTWVVRHGWASPSRSSEPALAEALQAAKTERTGMWRGETDAPESLQR